MRRAFSYKKKIVQYTPNWCNWEQVSIIINNDKQRLKKIDEKLLLPNNPLFLVFCVDFYRIIIAFEKTGKEKENFYKYIKNIDTLLIGSHDADIAI